MQNSSHGFVDDFFVFSLYPVEGFIVDSFGAADDNTTTSRICFLSGEYGFVVYTSAALFCFMTPAHRIEPKKRIAYILILRLLEKFLSSKLFSLSAGPGRNDEDRS